MLYFACKLKSHIGVLLVCGVEMLAPALRRDRIVRQRDDLRVVGPRHKHRALAALLVALRLVLIVRLLLALVGSVLRAGDLHPRSKLARRENVVARPVLVAHSVSSVM